MRSRLKTVAARIPGEADAMPRASPPRGTAPALALRAGSVAVALIAQTAAEKRTCSNQRASYSLAFHRRFNNVHRSSLAALIMVGIGEIA